MSLVALKLTYLVLGLAITGYVAMSRTQWKIQHGLRALGIGVGLVGLALLARFADVGGGNMDTLADLLALRDRRHFGMTRVVGFGYVVLLFGVEILMAAGLQRLRSAGRPSQG